MRSLCPVASISALPAPAADIGKLNSLSTFTELPISTYLQDRLLAAGFVTPTDIQAAAIPHAVLGKDVIATAQTGTGKTLAFLVPIMDKLLQQPTSRPGALVLVPTRELALQIGKQYEQLRGKKLPGAALLIGGTSERGQLQAVRAGAKLIIATPGRFEDLLDRKLIAVDSVNILVLDEVDRMLDMGFIPAIRRIVGQLTRSRQTLCFSATLETSVAHLIHDYVRSPIRLSFGSTTKASESVNLTAYEVQTDQKLALLKRLLKDEGGRTLVFVRTKRATDRLADKLKRHGMNVGVLHGDRSQSQRNSALTAFQHGRSRILVATDVASRGIHVDDISQVINYDLPAIPEDFIHRVGRTGRAGAKGSASIFFSGIERPDLARLERTLQLKMRRGRVDGDLDREERTKPVDVSCLAPVPAKPGARMMCLPGEILQRYQG
ncbi:MAG TPA: DEAD/DEAH box helicase [Candidatus Angelobacter sp.]|nr:DEAD/DEAH box helicase [Candidatus Angelobacter sp.]